MVGAQSNNSRIAKNTLLLYMRTLLVMAISLYTSRVILEVLGVEDYGIYQVVGGFVAMFSVISGTMSSAISRFITFELGHGNKERLKRIFCTSVNIQIIISVIVAFMAEIIGLWFMNNKMQIPAERLVAAHWVLQFSILSFCVNILSVPYNACIIAHEHMKAFAYVSLFEVTAKLMVCFAIQFMPVDKLQLYGFLLMLLAICVRFVYSVYSKRHFEECRYEFIYDKAVVKEMLNFTGWSFFSNSAYIFNTQGVNMLINVFFGVTLNAARGIATQIENAVLQFVTNFTMAVNPQITKSYAANEIDSMFILICRGAKFSAYLLLIFSIPIIVEADQILLLWLKNVPDHTANFVRLTLISSFISGLGNTGITACMATGNIKRYVLLLTVIGFLVFPLSWLAFKLGAPAESTYVIFVIIYILVDMARLYMMHYLLKFPPMLFVKQVLRPLALTLICSLILPAIIVLFIPPTTLRLFISVVVCIFSTASCAYMVGLTKREREVIKEKIKKYLKAKY